NETFKWDDLSYTIRKEKSIEVDKELFEYNQSFGKNRAELSIPSKQKTKREYVVVDSIKKIRNIYNKGAWENLKELIFPLEVK
ncbi:hypothetical protein HK096_001385, partial [Nowakowskiella sp. JEL0078]